MVLLKNIRFIVHGVAAEELICPLSGQNNLYIFARKLRNKKQRNAGGVSERLIHMVLYFFNIAPELLGGNQLFVVLHINLFGKALRPVDFIVLFAEIKPYGKGFLPREIRCHIAGIYTTGKEAAYLNIANLVAFYRFLEHFFNAVNCFLFGEGFIWLKTRLPIAGGRHLAVTVPQVVCGQKAKYTFKKGFRWHRILKREVIIQRIVIQALFKPREL